MYKKDIGCYLAGSTGQELGGVRVHLNTIADRTGSLVNTKDQVVQSSIQE